MGCKEGYFANAIRNNGWITHAVEHDPTAREYGNKRFMLQIEDGRRFFDINPRSYNVVVAWDTLGEAVDIHRTMDKLAQLIVKDGTVRMMPVAAPANSTADRIVEQVPDLLDKVASFIDSRTEKKAE